MSVSRAILCVKGMKLIVSVEELPAQVQPIYSTLSNRLISYYNQQKTIIVIEKQKLMIQQPRGSLRVSMLHQHTIQDEIISHILSQRISSDSYIKVITNNLNFAPIYFYTVEYRQIEQEFRKSNKSVIKMNPTLHEHIFRFGSQVYLKMLPQPNANDKVGNNYLHYQVTQVRRIQNKIYPQFSLFQVLIKGQFLTRRSDEIKLIDESENESIWAFEQIQDGNLYRICNISSNQYLCSQRRVDAHKEKFMLGVSKSADDPSTIFLIERKSEEHVQYLTLTPQKSQRKASSLSPSLQSQSYRISLQPAGNSVANLVYELSFAEQMLANSPSLHFLNEFIQELIYYNISQFGENQTLLSAPIQSLLADSLSPKIYKFLSEQISASNYNSQLAFVVESKIRLLCLGSPQNSQIFSKLVSQLLDSFDQSSYLPCLIKLVAGNNDLIRRFQSNGWCTFLFQKLQLAYSTKDFLAFHNLLLLIAQFCKGPRSLANKYLVMHILEAIHNENSIMESNNNFGSQTNWSKNEGPKKVNYWIRFFKDGIYEYVQIQEGNKLKEIELETYLNTDPSHRLIYIGQMTLMSALCQCFSLNSINKYYKIFKEVSSYCFNQTYPFFGNADCKQQTLRAIATSFDWTDSNHRLQNKYNIGCVFGDSDGSRLEKGSRDRNISKIKIQLVGNRSMYYKQSETITDVFKHFVIEFQNCMSWAYRKCKQRNISIANFMLSNQYTQEKFGGNIKHWIKVFVIALDARLITVLKKRTGPYIEYFKKIFDTKKTPEKNPPKKSTTPMKKQNNRGQSPSSFPFEIDKQFENQTNVLLDLLTRIIKYNQTYETYIQYINSTGPAIKANRETFMERMLNPGRKSVKRLSQKNTNEPGSKTKTQDYNKVIFIQGVLTQNKKENINYVNSVKLQSCKVITLIYQNIIEENIQYEIKNLGYAVQGSTKFTNNILTLEQGFKKFPFVDEAFRLSLWQNWYITSHPQNLNEFTNVLRYVYDQPQIYLRAMNTTLALFSNETVYFYEGVQASMLQAQRLTMCIETWYIPQILKTSPIYLQNYKMLDQALRTVNSQVRKLNITQKCDMENAQQILENLGLFDISSKLLAHLNQLELIGMRQPKQANSIKIAQVRSLANQSSALYNELTQILQFYVHNNKRNKFKLLVSIGEHLCQSVNAISILMFLLKQPTDMQKSIAFLTSPMIQSIVLMLPHTHQFLQVLLLLYDAQFILVIDEVSRVLMKQSKQANLPQKMEKLIIKDRGCFKTVCKVAYRVLLLHSCCQMYLEWFYDEILCLYLETYLSANAHFLRQKFQSIPLSLVSEKSIVAFLINALYFSNKSSTLEMNRIKRQQPARIGDQLQSYGSQLKNPLGLVVVQNYILSQLFVTVIENDLKQIAPYIEYYLCDLLPLLRVFNGRVSKDDTKNILNKCKEYLDIYNTNNMDKSNQNLTASMTGKEVKTKLKLMPSINYDQKATLFNPDKKLIDIQKFLQQDIMPQNFSPRVKYIVPPARPQVQSPHSPRKIEKSKLDISQSLKQKADSFQKMSKKATKLWTKAKQTINQNKQSYINRDKWSEDLKKLGTQYETTQRQKLINSSDIISKIVSIILNMNIIVLDPQNMLFLIKNLINWVQKIADIKTKKKKKGEITKNNQTQQSIYLIKKIQVQSTIISLLELVQQVSHNKFKNVMFLCYLLKLISLLIDVMECSFSMQSEQKICNSILQIATHLTNAFTIHQFIISEYKETKVLDSSMSTTDWTPIKLLSQIAIKICKVQIFSLSSVKLLAKAFMTMKIRLGKRRGNGPQLQIIDAIDQLKRQGEQTFKQAQKQVILNNLAYEVLSNIDF